MELSQLRALRELRDRGSIAAVAKAMHVTPSSVSQQLSALQRKAGAQLTQLDGRRTVLTKAGLALAEAAVGVETALARAHAAMDTFNQEPSPITVSAFHSAALIFGPSLVRQRPGSTPSVRMSDEDVPTEAFPPLTMRYDLVIAHRMAGSAPWPSTIKVTPLLSEPMDVAFRIGHRLDGLPALTTADVAGESWIAVHEGFPLEVAVRRAAGASGEDANIVHRINDFGVAAAMVTASNHLALLPRYMTGTTPGLRLAAFNSDLGFSLSRRVDVLCRPETLEKPGVRDVLDVLRKIGADLSGGRHRHA